MLLEPCVSMLRIGASSRPLAALRVLGNGVVLSAPASVHPCSPGASFFASDCGVGLQVSLIVLLLLVVLTAEEVLKK